MSLLTLTHPTSLGVQPASSRPRQSESAASSAFVVCGVGGLRGPWSRSSRSIRSRVW
jgi:hypothetical protein